MYTITLADTSFLHINTLIIEPTPKGKFAAIITSEGDTFVLTDENNHLLECHKPSDVISQLEGCNIDAIYLHANEDILGRALPGTIPSQIAAGEAYIYLTEDLIKPRPLH